MVPFKPYFLGDERRPVAACGNRAEVRAGWWQTQRSRRDRSYVAPSHILRDAGQLQFRRLLQRKGHSLCMGVRDRDTAASTPPGSGSRSISATTRPSRSGETSLACRPSESSDLMRITIGVWPTPGHAGRARRSSGTRVRRMALTVGLPMVMRIVSSRSGTSCSCSSSSAATVRRSPLPKPNIDTGAGLERILSVLQDVDSVWDTDEFQRLLRTASTLAGVKYGGGDEVRRVDAHPGRSRTFHSILDQRRGVPFQQRSWLRAAAHHAASHPPRLHRGHRAVGAARR